MLRKYKESDKEVLKNMLSIENIKDEEMTFSTDSTFVLMKENKIKGFFSFKVIRQYPVLRHFCVDKKYRSAEMARLLAKLFKLKAKEYGFKKAIIDIKSNNAKLDKIIRYYFKTKSYAEQNGYKYYCVDM